jgi:rod shape determining protein RodA
MSGLREIPAMIGRMNWVMNLVVVLLIATGVLFIFSATHTREDSTVTLWRQQVVWAVAGLSCYLVTTVMDYRRLRDVAWWFYGMAVVLLVAVLFFGTRIYGARRWLMFLGVGVQPSELAKIAVILAAACLMAPPVDKFERRPAIGWSLLLVSVPMLLIMKEPDLGSALVFVPVIMAMLFAAGAAWRPMAAMVVSGLLLVALLLAAVALPQRLGVRPETQDRFFAAIGLSAYQRDRLEVFIQPGKDPLGTGWNKRQSEIAVGSGGLTGKGYLQGTQNILGFLPKTVAPTDFIFSVIAEESGFAGAAGVLAAFAALIVAGLYAAMVARDKMGRVLCVGIVTLVFTHVFVNVAMTMGLVPVVGIPLPLISYGGTFMVISLFALGLVQSVYVRRQGP